MKKLWVIVPMVMVISITLAAGYWLFGKLGNSDQIVIFVVPQSQDNYNLPQALFEQKLIRNVEAFTWLMHTFSKNEEIKSGGYRLAANMNAWQVMKILTGKPNLAWVTISFCPRKEQVGEKLATALGWGQEEVNKWNTVYTNTKPEYFEGVYYPDIYLIPTDEPGAQVAQRFINRFNEKFGPLADKFVAKNIKWTTGLKIASLIAREAAGPDDMKLISGIIWNRLNQGMRLQIDATMQYTLGKSPDGSWWGNINLEQKRSDSPYNTYLNEGLPPTPICSPSIEAIEAALNPEETECLFYLHDADLQIHCAKTYEEHKENIDKYL